MFNTLAQLPDPDARFDARLNELAAVDPHSTAQIRESLAAFRAGIPPPTEPVEEQIAAWGEENPDILLLLGAPSARDMEQLLRRFPAPCQLFLMEYRIPRIATLFTLYPFEKEVCEGRLILALGQDEDLVETRFLPLVNLRTAPHIRVLESAAADQEADAFYHRALQQAKKSVRLNVFNLGTLVYRGPLWQHNTIKNLPELIGHPGVTTLDGLFAGRPAIVVGAGPSLNDTLPHLAQLKNRFVIISTGTALRPLQAAGIRPDLVMSVDGSRKTAPQFETECGDLYLACSSLAFPPVVRKFKGIFSASMAANPISEWLNRQGDAKGSLIAAGTVTTTAMDLAVHMGCNPVICLGTDLSFRDDGTTHASHSMYHGSRLDTSKLVEVPGNYCEKVFTTAQFKCYIDLMEDFISTLPDIRFVNCTTGGAHIAGMDLLAPGGLHDLADEPFDAYSAIQTTHDRCSGGATPGLKTELENILGELEDIQEQAHRAAMICNQLIMILRAPREGDRDRAQEYLQELQTIDRRLTADGPSSIFLDMSLWPIGYQTTAPREGHEEHYSDAILANRRSRNLYEQIAGAAKWTRELLAGVLPRIVVREETTASASLAAFASADNKEFTYEE